MRFPMPRPGAAPVLVPLVFLVFLVFLAAGLAGCDRADQNPTCPPDDPAKARQPRTVEGIAAQHNERVAELVTRFGPRNPGGIPDFQTVLEEWGCAKQVDLPAARRSWRLKRRLFARGLRPADLHSLTGRVLADARTDPELRATFHDHLRHCLELLLDNRPQALPQAVEELAELARLGGSPREAEIAGVFLGSVRRWSERVRIQQDHPWYPWVVGMDQLGTLIGGPEMGALWSADAELIVFTIIIPWWWLP